MFVVDGIENAVSPRSKKNSVSKRTLINSAGRCVDHTRLRQKFRVFFFCDMVFSPSPASADPQLAALFESATLLDSPDAVSVSLVAATPALGAALEGKSSLFLHCLDAAVTGGGPWSRR